MIIGLFLVLIFSCPFDRAFTGGRWYPENPPAAVHDTGSGGEWGDDDSGK